MKIVLVANLFLCLTINNGVESSEEDLKTLTVDFTKALDACKAELNIQNDINEDFKNFWKVGYVATKREFGCAIVCLSKKLDLVTSDGSLHHGNAMELAKKRGLDEAKARQIIDILHACENAADKNPDECMSVLDVANCFKKEIHKLNWAPDMDLMAEEFLSEV